jgi:hypothetical protein
VNIVLPLSSSLRAQRSNPSRRVGMDCFVALLLAMTTSIEHVMTY